MADETPCPICHGTGIVTCIDEEVGCQVELPCWHCTPETPPPVQQHPSSNTPAATPQQQHPCSNTLWE